MTGEEENHEGNTNAAASALPNNDSLNFEAFVVLSLQRVMDNIKTTGRLILVPQASAFSRKLAEVGQFLVVRHQLCVLTAN